MLFILARGMSVYRQMFSFIIINIHTTTIWERFETVLSEKNVIKWENWSFYDLLISRKILVEEIQKRLHFRDPL